MESIVFQLEKNGGIYRVVDNGRLYVVQFTTANRKFPYRKTCTFSINDAKDMCAKWFNESD